MECYSYVLVTKSKGLIILHTLQSASGTSSYFIVSHFFTLTCRAILHVKRGKAKYGGAQSGGKSIINFVNDAVREYRIEKSYEGKGIVDSHCRHRLPSQKILLRHYGRLHFNVKKLTSTASCSLTTMPSPGGKVSLGHLVDSLLSLQILTLRCY